MTRSQDIETLERLVSNLATQDNRCTADPIFMVQVSRRIIGIDTQWDPQICWVQTDYVLTKEQPGEDPSFDELEAEYDRTGKEPEDWTRAGYADRWENVQPFFTEHGAEEYIRVNGHNLGGPHRIYVESAYRNAEWQALARVLPYLILCGKFVEEHGEITLAILEDSFSHRSDGFSLERAAAEALDALRGKR
jgi:hypothetical protein